MLDPAELLPDDRLLFLGIPDFAIIAECARRLEQGIVVAMGEDDAVREARKAGRDLENVMFVPGAPDEIPWSDGFFTRVIDLVGSWPEPDRVRSEIARVTMPAPK